MYNEKIKNEYLSTLPIATAKSQKSYFQKIEAYEKKLQKDILFFSNAEFGIMMQEIKGLSIGSSLYNLPGCIKRYGKWYSENYTPVDFQTAFTVDYLKISPSYYKSPLELIEDIDSVIIDLTQEQGIPLNIIAGYLKEIRLRYNVGIGIILLSWCGLTIDEIINLKSENVLKEENKIYIEDKKALASIDPSIMFVLSQIKTGQSYAKIVVNTDTSGQMSERVFVLEDFQYTEYFLKKRGKSANYTNPISKNLINLSLSELNNNKKNITFSLKMLRENGMLYAAYQKSKKEIDMYGANKENKDYSSLFGNLGKTISKSKFDELKYKYKAYVKLVEGKK